MPVWDDVITEGDRDRFARAFSDARRVGFGRRPALLVVDMCRAFVDDEYATAAADRARPTVRAIARLLLEVRSAPVPVPVVFTTYAARDFALGWARWKGKALEDPMMWDDRAFEVVDELAPAGAERVLVKTMPSAFFGTALASLLNFHGVDTIIVTGMVTSGCIRATVVDAFSYNYRVIVPEECVADRAETSHKVNLFDIHMKYADVLPLDEVIKRLAEVWRQGPE